MLTEDKILSIEDAENPKIILNIDISALKLFDFGMKNNISPYVSIRYTDIDNVGEPEDKSFEFFFTQMEHLNACKDAINEIQLVHDCANSK